MTYQDTITLSTSVEGEMHDLTEDVANIVRRSEIRVGTTCPQRWGGCFRPVATMATSRPGTMGTVILTYRPPPWALISPYRFARAS